MKTISGSEGAERRDRRGDTESGARTNNAQIQKSDVRTIRDERGSDRVVSTEPFKLRLREFEKTIHSEEIAIDTDKSLHWIEANLDGKYRKLMLVDLGINEIRLPARLASDLGVRPESGDQAVDIATVDGRSIHARTAGLKLSRSGSFTYRDVDCVVLAETAGDFPPVLGRAFSIGSRPGSTSMRGAIMLTEVQVKPISPLE